MFPLTKKIGLCDGHLIQTKMHFKLQTGNLRNLDNNSCWLHCQSEKKVQFMSVIYDWQSHWGMKISLSKSVNLQYNTLSRLDDGTNDSSTKRLMFQVLFFFMISWKILCKNPFNLFSYFFIQLQKIKSFECPKSIKSIKKIILGTSDSWSTIRLSHRPSNPA